ncbi:hypothetical protein QL886_04485 [Psychrobacter sp. APC 3281]|uniref:hypothetical protein n=1 Tax=Psychrobacter sp. APC 3281 TaxID=3035190 RepID=UPI0025B500CD|nr:hypothetical protein [Psychrobacter sp. APC 3281]MDN3446890.1 hypothetical protein [Psychrobacter sp. APC 3281]
MHKAQHFLDLVSSRTSGSYLYQLLSLMGFVILLLVSNFAVANPFATPNDFSAESCPSGHKKYNIANNASTAPSLSSWKSGEELRTFTFNENSGSKVFTISFSDIEDIYLGNGRSKSPFYDSLNGVTSSAITLSHISTTVKTNHSLTVQVDRSVSKIGYKIQDLDSTGSSNQIPYIEEAEAFNNGRLTYFPYFHEITNNSKVTGRAGRNCSVNECNIDATWPYSTANSPVVLKHRNTRSDRGLTSTHSVGYSDFYFCLAPPKIIVNKLLDGSRVDGDDQFRIELRRTDNNTFVEAFTTSGSGAVISDNTTTVTTLTEGVNYTVTEQTINGNLLDYQTTYTCSNATTGTDVVFSSGEMAVNNAGTRRTFAINNVSYGDEITCTITNTPASYTFSGFVFNDNGNVLSPSKDDISSKYLSNSFYFNGKYDSPTESGIPFTTGHTVTLNKCTTDSGTFSPQTVNIGNDGTYSFSLTAAQVGSYTRLCVTQNEPSNYTYSVDTTSNVLQIDITNSKYNYPSNNFGDVVQENSALVLIKSQYVHDCSLNNLATIGVNYDGSASSAYSTKPISDIIPGQCIAYRIEAINRGNVSLADIIIKDTLQSRNDSNNSSITSTLVNPTPIGENSGTPSFATNSVSIGNNGTVTTNTFSLGATTATRRQAIRFNTKYGTTISN